MAFFRVICDLIPPSAGSDRNERVNGYYFLVYTPPPTRQHLLILLLVDRNCCVLLAVSEESELCANVKVLDKLLL